MIRHLNDYTQSANCGRHENTATQLKTPANVQSSKGGYTGWRRYGSIAKLFKLASSHICISALLWSGLAPKLIIIQAAAGGDEELPGHKFLS